MNKVYEHSEDVHVRCTYVYASVITSDTFAYADSKCTVKLNRAELEDLFLKGAAIVAGGAAYKPISMKTASGTCTVTYIKADSTTATTAVLATLKSAADA